MVTAVAVATSKALIVLSFIILVLGLFKPKWVLFWMKEPNRLVVSCIALVLFMASTTAFTYFTVPPKAKTERQRTNDEINNLNLGTNPSAR